MDWESDYLHTIYRAAWMSKGEKTKLGLISASRDKAVAFIEDFDHIKELVKTQYPERGTIRRLSSVIRRLLIDNDGDLRDIAAPRIGRFHVLGYDLRCVHKYSTENFYYFFANGPANLYAGRYCMIGAFVKEKVIVELGKAKLDSTSILMRNSEAVLVSLSQDAFLSQKILCGDGVWFSRRGVLKYIANIASGVHSGIPTNPTDVLLKRMRYSLSNYQDALNLRLFADPSRLDEPDPGIELEPYMVDVVLLEILATAYLLSISLDLIQLEQSIKAELRLSPARG